MTKPISEQVISIGKNVFETLLNVRPSETIVLITDPYKQTEANIFLAAAKSMNIDIRTVTLTSMTENAQEPDAATAQTLVLADVALLVTRYSLSHTKARKDASQSGTRIISMPGITSEMMVRTLSQDYAPIAKLSKKLATRLSNGKKVVITTDNGTCLSFSINDRSGIADTGFFTQKGDFGNLPAGEAFIAPLEDSAEGTLVIDGALANIEIDTPVSVRIQHGRAIAIEGGRAASTLQKRMNNAGPKASMVGEFGIGTNPKAQLGKEILEAEKVYGTIHIAFGNNIGFGGKTDVAFHTDGVIKNPKVVIDNIPL